MRFRWTRLLPGFPAILLVPSIVAAWVILAIGPFAWLDGGWQWEWPFRFAVLHVDWAPNGHPKGWSVIGMWACLADVSLVLAIAWALPMAFDRLFRKIRAARMKKRGRQPGSPV